MPSLSSVLMGSAEDRRIIGYVDELGGVYNLQQQRIGAVGMVRNNRYAIQDWHGSVVGSVDVSTDASGGHAVYDNLNVLVGAGFAGRFVEAAARQVGVIAYNAGHRDQGGVIAGAALLLLVHSPVATPMWAGGTTGDQVLQEGLRAAQEGFQQAQAGIHNLLEEHAQTLAERQMRAKTGSVVDRSAGRRMKAIGTTVVEMIPGGLGPWGIGDVVTLCEGAVGRTLDGLRLSRLERLIYFGASVIPVVPARPVVMIYRLIERGRAHEAELREAELRGAQNSEHFEDIPSAADLDPLNLSAMPSDGSVGAAPQAAPQLSTWAGQWETCQIEARPTMMNMRVYFTAEALGTRGVYTAAASRGVGTASGGTDVIKKHGPVVQELVNKLIAQGWEPMPDRGPYWFSYRFRRRVR